MCTVTHLYGYKHTYIHLLVCTWICEMCGWSVNQPTEVRRWERLLMYITVFICLYPALPHLVTSTVNEYSGIRYSMPHIFICNNANTADFWTSGHLGIWLCVLLVCSPAGACKAEAEIIINCNAYFFKYMCMYVWVCELLHMCRKTKWILVRIKLLGKFYYFIPKLFIPWDTLA